MRHVIRQFVRHVRADARASAKWALIVFVPAAALVVAASVLLGNIHGWGGVPLLIAFAPFIVLNTLFPIPRSDNPLGLLLAIPLEWGYLFLLVLVFRFVFRRHRQVDIGQRSK